MHAFQFQFEFVFVQVVCVLVFAIGNKQTFGNLLPIVKLRYSNIHMLILLKLAAVINWFFFFAQRNTLQEFIDSQCVQSCVFFS
jgi:hypothetical protein